MREKCFSHRYALAKGTLSSRGTCYPTLMLFFFLPSGYLHVDYIITTLFSPRVNFLFQLPLPLNHSPHYKLSMDIHIKLNERGLVDFFCCSFTDLLNEGYYDRPTGTLRIHTSIAQATPDPEHIYDEIPLHTVPKSVT